MYFTHLMVYMMAMVFYNGNNGNDETSCNCYLWLTQKIADANILKDAAKTYRVVTNTQKITTEVQNKQ